MSRAGVRRMLDLAYLALTVALFALVGLIARAVDSL